MFMREAKIMLTFNKNYLTTTGKISLLNTQKHLIQKG